MPVFTGRNILVGLAPETTRGTAATPTYWIARDGFSVLDKQTRATDDDAYGIIEGPVASDLTEQWAEGSISGNLHDTSEGVFLKNIFGAVSSADHSGETLVKDHTFTVGENAQHPSFTVASVDANENVAFSNSMLSKYEIDFALSKYMTRSVDLQAHKSATASNTAALTTENKFRMQDFTLKVASTVAGLAGAAALPVKGAKLTLAQKLSREQALGSINISDIYNLSPWSASCSFDLLYNDLTFKNYVFNNTPLALQIALTRSDITIGTAANPTLTFTFQPGYFTDWSKDVKNDDLTAQSSTYQGMYSLAAPGMVTAVLTNTATGY